MAAVEAVCNKMSKYWRFVSQVEMVFVLFVELCIMPFLIYQYACYVITGTEGVC